MPLVADVLFRIGVGLVRMDRRVRATGLALVVVQSKSPAHAACISKAGRQSGSVRAGVHRGLREPGDHGVEGFTRLQPMRSLHLLYAIFFILLGGLIGEYGIKKSTWRWVALFVPLALIMVLVQETTFPASQHVEWPGSNNGNTWMSAFLWIRYHTPKDAVFATDPNYMARPGEDAHGFRAVAERSVLADSVKDSGAVSLFPRLATEWQSQVRG